MELELELDLNGLPLHQALSTAIVLLLLMPTKTRNPRDLRRPLCPPRFNRASLFQPSRNHSPKTCRRKIISHCKTGITRSILLLALLDHLFFLLCSVSLIQTYADLPVVCVQWRPSRVPLAIATTDQRWPL